MVTMGILGMFLQSVDSVSTGLAQFTVLANANPSTCVGSAI